MNYLEHFHFDNVPFPTDNSINYFYPKKQIVRIINELTKNCRFYNGITLITGNNGIGKTTILKKFVGQVKNNDFVIFISSNEKTNFMKILAQNLGVENKIEEIFNELEKIYSTGKNIIIIIDDAQEFKLEQLIDISSLFSTLKYLKIILTGNKYLRKKIKTPALKELRKNIITHYKVKHFSFTQTIKYISYISTSALALSQYKKVFSLPQLCLLSYATNRNLHNVNFITSEVLKKTVIKQNQKVKIKTILEVIKENYELVKENLYLKFQKIFMYVLLLLSLYFFGKIVIDRYNLISNIEAEKSIRVQEQQLRDK